MNDKIKAESIVEKAECAPDLEHILEWTRLMACQIRQNAAGIEKYRGILKTKGENERRLQEFDNWRKSSVFTEREKVALILSESMTSRHTEELSQNVLKEAKRLFNRTEMVSLTLGILEINDWIKAHTHSPSRILVVEDDPLDQELLQLQLKKAQLDGNVLFVSDAQEALTVLEDYRNGNRKGDLIALFLDLHLPGMSGLELLRKIRAMEDIENLPVIVMTNSSDPDNMKECHKLRVVSYVRKPVTFAAFSNAVANIFHQARETVPSNEAAS